MTIINSIRWALARVFAFISLCIGLGALVGYAYGQPALLVWSTNGVPMALPTAVAFVFLSLASLLKSNPSA